MSAMLAVDVWRGDVAGGHLQRFTVPRLTSQTVLDVVTEIQRTQDPTLSYRFACRVGMCGSCAMMVNGRARWTCRTHVADVMQGDTLELRPLRNLPVIRDLVTDMSVFFDKLTQAHGRFQGARTRHDDVVPVQPASKARRAADASIECIGCGVCYASCDVVAQRPDYLGPAALNRAWSLVNDERDVGNAARLDAVLDASGAPSCHTQMSCTANCPKHLPLTGAIAELKHAGTRAWLRGES
ncbi:MAG: succinate dehydrogenase/fumarate reductase iron-sulfur subunit [Burkholderiales bacterium]|nr:succinate dehydrogenase/fumarate reductase iron-sulfur subunit [Burkholderiales bacterium]